MTKHYIALDIGGTKIEAMLADKRHKVIKKIRSPTEVKKGKVQVIKNIVSTVDIVRGKKKIAAVGISLAGLMRPGNEIMDNSPNIPCLNRLNMKKELQKRLKVPVYIRNDSKCLTLSEFHLGAAKGSKNCIGMIWGTGVAFGIIINKKLYNGTNNKAGEIGHHIIVADGEMCSCKRKGHFEQYVSARALIKNYKTLTGKTLPPKEIVARSKKDPKARKALDRVAHYMAIGLANAVQAYDPEVIVLGGGMSNLTQLYPIIRKQMKSLVFGQKFRIVKSRLGDSSGIYGALMLALKKGKV